MKSLFAGFLMVLSCIYPSHVNSNAQLCTYHLAGTEFHLRQSRRISVDAFGRYMCKRLPEKKKKRRFAVRVICVPLAENVFLIII